MNQLPRIPWEAIFSNFIWIVGAAIILADFSYHDFLAHREKVKLKSVLKRRSFKMSLLSGMTLMFLGIAASIHKLWLSISFGCLTILFIFEFVKVLRSDSASHP